MLLQDYPAQCMHFVIRNMIHFYNGILMCLLYGIYLFRIDLYIGIITLAAYMAVGGNMTLGTLTVVFTFYEKLAKQIAYISQNFLDGQNRVSYIQSIYRFLHAPTEPDRTDKLEITNGEILFSNLSFGYEDDEKLLKNITMKIRPGEHVAIVGKSGCGKTTLASLLIGFYREKEGYIAIDGQRLDSSDVKSVRSGIGYVLQEVLIFDGTIRENLLMGNLRAEEEDIIRAYRAAAKNHSGKDVFAGY